MAQAFGKDDIKAAARYVCEACELVGLRDWTVKVSADPAPPDCHASIDCTQGRKVAVVRFGDSFWALTAEEQRDTVAHELIHAHLSALEYLLQAARPVMGEAAFSVLRNAHHEAIEWATDALSAPVARGLPMPGANTTTTMMVDAAQVATQEVAGG